MIASSIRRSLSCRACSIKAFQLTDGSPRRSARACWTIWLKQPVKPPLPTVDQHGATFDLAQLSGRPVLLTFVFGHCPVICPNLTSTLKRASLAYPGTPPPVVVVTLDPWRDTPAALPGLLSKWGLAELPGDMIFGEPASRRTTTQPALHPSAPAIQVKELRATKQVAATA